MILAALLGIFAVLGLLLAILDFGAKMNSAAPSMYRSGIGVQNPPRVDGGRLDENRVIDLMRTAADALSTMIGVAAKSTRTPQESETHNG